MKNFYKINRALAAKKKIFTFFLALVASAGTLFAASGTCGDNLTWDLTNYVLTISGTGAMDNYTSSSNAPWYSSRSNITSIVISDGVTTIGDYAFYYCKKATSVTLPNSLTSIGKYAFGYCNGLTTVTIPASVTAIGSYAFYNCQAMTSVNIPDGITTIEASTFYSCSKLTSIEIPNSVTTIGKSAFYMCNGLTTVTIPASVTNMEQAFYYCSGLTSVIFSEGITTISASAFYGCNGLTSLSFPNTVTTIETKAFYSCKGLTDVTIPASITAINTQAFYYCSGLTAVHISDLSAWCKIAFTGYYANPLFYAKHLYLNDKEVTDLVIPYDVVKVLDYTFYGCEGLTSVTFPEGLKSIYDYAFCKCTGLTTITLPSTLENILDGAFDQCTGLTSITTMAVTAPRCSSSSCFNKVDTSIPLNVPWEGVQTYRTSSVWSMFTNILVDGECLLATGTCGQSSSPDLKWQISCDSVLTIFGNGYMTSWDQYKSHPWSSSLVKSVVFEEGVKNIGSNAFSYCSHLRSITIPDNIAGIGSNAFLDCTNLESAYIGSGVTSIGIGVFQECENLVSIVVSSDNKKYDSRFECNAIVEKTNSVLVQGCNTTVIPNNVSSIEEKAFYGFTGLTTARIPYFVTSIGAKAFYGCTGLKSLTCNATTPPSCGTDCFKNVDKSIPLRVPEGKVSAYQAANVWKEFTNITDAYGSGKCGDNLSWALNSEGILTITGSGAMTDWESETAVPWYADRAMIQSVELPEGLTTIGAYAFSGFTALTTITIPKNVTAIGAYAFSGCTGLKNLTCLAVTPPVCGENCFDGVPKCTLTVPSASASEYSQTAPWNNFYIPATSGTLVNNPNIAWRLTDEGELILTGTGDIVPDADDAYNLSVYPWDNYTNSIKAVIIGEGITGIGTMAFAYCSNMESLSLPNSLTVIGAGVCNVCSSLTTLIIPNNVTSIRDKAFTNCYGLTTLILGSGLEEISANAFYKSITSYTTVTCLAVTPPTCVYQGNVFGEHDDVTLYVPAESVSAYKTAYTWNEFDVKPIEDQPKPVIIDSGTCGDEGSDLTWELTSDATLTVMGEGAMCNWINPAYFASPLRRSQLTEATYAPWYFYRSFILHIEIESGVTSIGDYAFYGCIGLQSVTCNAVTPPACGIETFGGVNTSIPLYVPEDAVEAYKAAATWKEFDVQAAPKTPEALDQITNDQLPITNKVIVNGQVLILRDGKTYTVTGQEIK